MMRLGAASEKVLLMYWALVAMLATLLLSCPSSCFLLYPVFFFCFFCAISASLRVMHYLIYEQLDLDAQLILLGALDRRKRFVEMLYRRIADVGDEVGEVLGALKLDLALDLRNDRLGIHVLRNMLCGSFLLFLFLLFCP